MTENRTETARDHDDSEMIDRASEAPSKVGRAGGDLQRDIGTQDELARVEDPDTTTRVRKEDDIANDEARPSGR